jgi:hypothetical protein
MEIDEADTRGQMAGASSSSAAAYPAARSVAPAVYAHFEHHIGAARRKSSEGVASLPDVGAIEELIGAAFWASLRREEGYIPRISLAWLAPHEVAHPLILAEPLPLDPGVLAKVAPAVERAGIHLGVWRDGGELRVWGTTRAIPGFCFVLEVAAPGLLVVKHHRGGESGKFVNVAVLEGDQVKVVDEHASSLPDCPELLTSLLGFDSPASWAGTVNVLVQLAVSMRAHGRGGALLVVPAQSDAWRSSIVQPIRYAVSPAYAALVGLIDSANQRSHAWEDAIGRAIDAIAGLTAIDGAAILSDRYELLAFGAKIARRKGSSPVEQVTVTEPIQGGVATLAHPTQLGGTRHLSAAQFVHDQRDAIALVASQDGRFTVFAWSPCEAMVHAHRVEALLL